MRCVYDGSPRAAASGPLVVSLRTFSTPWSMVLCVSTRTHEDTHVITERAWVGCLRRQLPVGRKVGRCFWKIIFFQPTLNRRGLTPVFPASLHHRSFLPSHTITQLQSIQPSNFSRPGTTIFISIACYHSLGSFSHLSWDVIQGASTADFESSINHSIRPSIS